MPMGPCNIVALGYAPFGQLNMLYLFGSDGTLYIVTARREIENREELQSLRHRDPLLARLILKELVPAFEKEARHRCIAGDDYRAWLARARFDV